MNTLAETEGAVSDSEAVQRNEPVVSGDQRVRPGTTWKSLAVCAAVAVVLSVTATLLLLGAFRPGGGGSLAGTWGAGECCRPRSSR